MTAQTHADLDRRGRSGGEALRKPTSSAARTPPAGGRASCAPT